MPALEQVDRHEDGQQVHVGRVELEVHVGWAEVVARRHESDHEKGETHRVEEGEGRTGSRSKVGHFSVRFRDLASQLEDSWPTTFPGWFHAQPLQFSSEHHVLLHKGDEEEEKAKEHVARVAQDVIPHWQA